MLSLSHAPAGILGTIYCALGPNTVLPIPLVPYLLFSLSSIITALLTPPKMRGRLLRAIGNIGSGGRASHESRRAAAVVAAFIGGKKAVHAMSRAEGKFRALPLASLTVDDLASNDDSGLFERTQPVTFGQVDAFVSHSENASR